MLFSQIIILLKDYYKKKFKNSILIQKISFYLQFLNKEI